MVDQSFLQSVERAWQEFFEEHKRNDRNSKKLMNQRLKENIQQLKLFQGAEHWKHAEALLWLTFEENVAIPVMNPELWSELFPYVKQGYEEQKMPHVKWMYQAFGFVSVYDYLQCQPEDVLRQALAIEPENNEVAELLYLEHLQLLDFALHELPIALCVDKQTCLNVVEEARELQKQFPHLKFVKRRYGGNLEVYEQVLTDWLAYQQTDRKVPFHDRREAI